VEYIGTGIVYDKTNNTMELLKGALQLGGESTNLGRNSSSRTECRMATQNSYNTSASFEAGLSLVQTENGARIEKWKIQVEPETS
jgi:23S rRNA maturation mini-RNase III